MKAARGFQAAAARLAATGLFALAAMLPGPAALAETGFVWDKWAAALNDDPCNWIPAEQIAAWYGPGMQRESSNNRTASSCRWSDGEGRPMLSLSVNSWPSPQAVNHERNAQIRQARDQAPSPFSEIPSAHQVTSNILRKDRLIVYIFANDEGETAFVTINGHRTLNENPEMRQLRRDGVSAATRFFLEKYRF